MNFSQIPLKIWDESYNKDFIIGLSNQEAVRTLLHHNGQILLTGPDFSGKKHIATKIAQMQNCAIFFIEHLNDAEIIASYDEMHDKKAIWVFYNSERAFSKDVSSRFNAMQPAVIDELTDDMIFPLLNTRLSNIGFYVRNEIVNYCIYRIPRTYSAVEQCVRYVAKTNKISFAMFKEFFEDCF